MSYRTNQFYNSAAAGEFTHSGGVPGSIPPNDNPRFVYPDNRVRIVDPNAPLINGKEQGLTSRRLERGYIRSLLTEAQGAQLPIKRCGFQFNPNLLQQSVAMNSSMLNFFMQDPGQMAQPLGSEVTFAFDMFFDRSLEMNNDRWFTRDDLDPTQPWATGDPAEVGVLRDIASFYAVIGQGISEDQAEFAGAQYKKNLEWEFTADDTPGDSTELDQAKANIDEYLSKIDVNLGNTAFLMPLPVRVMFSTLYMVEGYVTNTTVVYTKFNSAMVPMQATMTVSMRALYIGFAKKNTFVTEYIKESVDAERLAAKQAADDKKDAYKALLDEVGVVRFNASASFNPAAGSLNDILADKNFSSSLASWLPNARKDGPVVEMFEAGSTSLSISYNLTFKVFGPFNTVADINPQTGASRSNQSMTPILTLPNASPNFTSADEWKKTLYSEGTSNVPSNGVAQSLDTSKYYSWIVEGEARVKIGSQTLTGTINKKLKSGPGTSPTFWETPIEYDLAVNWGSTLDSNIESLPAIVDDSSSGVPDAGTPSDVGGGLTQQDLDDFIGGL